MTTKTWTGGHPGYNARNPQNWTPYGAAQAGDTLRMVSGRMDIDYASLPGELRLGPGNQLSTGPITLNIVWSNATVGARDGGTFLNFAGQIHSQSTQWPGPSN